MARPTSRVQTTAIAPMLATLTDRLPRDPDAWGFEFKWDGVRAIVCVDERGVTATSRNRLDITGRYPELDGLAAALAGRTAVLDGEVVAPDEQGRPSFQRLQRRMHVAADAGVRARMADTPVAYITFDVLELDGEPTVGLPYADRRRVLEALGLEGPFWHTPAFHAGEGAAMLEASRAQGLEGVMAKRLTSVYEPGRRSRAWLKIKNQRRQEFVIGGWTPGGGAREGRIGALLLGYYDGGDLRYAGHVGTGFTEGTLRDLAERLAPLRRDTSPFVETPRLPGATFVEPSLVADVEFSEWTGDDRLRHPSYKGVRDDKDPSQVVRERPEPQGGD